MKLLLYLLCVFGLCCLALGTPLDLYSTKEEYYAKLAPVDYSIAKAEETDVIYKLFTNSSQKEPIIVTKENVASIVDKNLPTCLLIHGWTTDDTSPWYQPLRDAYLVRWPHNIFYINWSKAGNKSYYESAANCKPIGEFIADFLIESKIPPSNTQLVGHSLGAHMAAFIGKSMYKKTGKKIGRLIGLDVAGPIFENPLVTKDMKFSDEDALFVDAYHTDIKLYGYAAPIGHVDFYPNYGRQQPGCPSKREEDPNCSHARSTLIFIESVNKTSVALEARYVENGSPQYIELVENGETAVFGQHINQSTRGVFYIKTNEERPFLIETES